MARYYIRDTRKRSVDVGQPQFLWLRSTALTSASGRASATSTAPGAASHPMSTARRIVWPSARWAITAAANL